MNSDGLRKTHQRKPIKKWGKRVKSNLKRQQIAVDYIIVNMICERGKRGVRLSWFSFFSTVDWSEERSYDELQVYCFLFLRVCFSAHTLDSVLSAEAGTKHFFFLFLFYFLLELSLYTRFGNGWYQGAREMVVMQLLELKCGLAISWDTNGPGLNDPHPTTPWGWVW